MIHIAPGEISVPISHAVIYKAAQNAELSIKMQRKLLLKQYKSAIEARKQLVRSSKYAARTSLLWRIFQFLNGDRQVCIQRIELTEAEIFSIENQTLAACVDMSLLDSHTDMAHTLKNAAYMNKDSDKLELPGKYLQFVLTFNPEAFEDDDIESLASTGEKNDSEVAQAPTDTEEKQSDLNAGTPQAS